MCILLLWFVAAYEAENHLPRGTIRQAVIGQANNAWELLERGEISVDEFSRKFSDDCSEIVSFLLYVVIINSMHNLAVTSRSTEWRLHR